MTQTKIKDSLIIGFAIFAIFFGAGNLIFPPQIGLVSGAKVAAGLAGMTLTGILLPMMAIIAVGNMGTNLRDVTKHVNLWWHILYMVLGLLIILFGTIPRTGAVAYETGLLGIFPNLPAISKWIFLIIFFALSYILASNRSGVVDQIGKFVTPALLVALLLIVVLAIINPIGKSQGGVVDNAFINGLLTAYYTGDVGTGLVCAGIFIAAIRNKGYIEKSSYRSVLYRSIVVAFILLLIIYGGLCIMGSQATTLFSPDIDNTSLLVGIIQRIAGYGGMVILSLAVILACFTTAAGMIATGSDWIDSAFKGRLPYKGIAAVVTLIILLMASTGASFVIRVSGPIFTFIYPMSIVMTILGVFRRQVPNDGVWKGAVYAATIFALYDAFALARSAGLLSLSTAGLDRLISAIPLAGQGLAWVVPSLIGGLIGGIVFKLMGGKNIPDEA